MPKSASNSIPTPTLLVMARRRKEPDPASHDCKCLRCGYGWKSRVESPKRCPSCISDKWMRAPRPGKYARGKDHPKVRDRDKYNPGASVVASKKNQEAATTYKYGPEGKGILHRP